MNELQIFTREGRASEQGFRTVLTAPIHTPYDKFIPAPGHGLGFNELKIIEAREVMRAISGETAHIIDFQKGLAIEKTVHAIAHSHRDGCWVRL